MYYIFYQKRSTMKNKYLLSGITVIALAILIYLAFQSSTSWNWNNNKSTDTKNIPNNSGKVEEIDNSKTIETWDSYTENWKTKSNSIYFKMKWDKIYVHDITERIRRQISIKNSDWSWNVSKIDYDSFQEDFNSFAQDKNSVYYCWHWWYCQKMKFFDPQTFKFFDEDYYQSKNKIYLFDINKTPEWKDIAITWININKFKTLGYWFAKDDKNIYYYWIALENKNIDISTFSLLNPYYYKDKNHVYTATWNMDEGIKIINLNWADSKTFQVFKDNYIKYAKDKNHVYIAWKSNNNLDPSSFEILTWDDRLTYGEIVKDKNHVYSCGSLLLDSKCIPFTGVDSSTTKLVSQGLLKDKNWIYDLGLWKKINNNLIDIATFEQLNYYYYKDKNSVYLLDWDDSDINFKIISWSDAKSIQIFGTDTAKYLYAKDKNHVYISGKIITKLDAATFQLLKLNESSLDWYIFKDKNGIYILDRDSYLSEDLFKPLNNIDKDSFKNIGINYYKDKNHIYYCSNEYSSAVIFLTWVDYSSFKTFPGESAKYHAKDAKHVYYKWNIINQADPNSFQILDFKLAKDKDSVFAWPKKIEWVDITSFKYLYTSSFSDKNYSYDVIEDYISWEDEYKIIKKNK